MLSISDDAQDFNNTHASIVAKHCKMFLQRAFGIKPDGTVITDLSSLPEKLKKYKSVKTYDKYNDMIHVISNWGDDVVLKEASSDDHKLLQSENSAKVTSEDIIDGSQRLILKHKNSGGVVSHMLNIFDVIQEAHCRQGHMKADKTLANCLPMYCSPTIELCTLICMV